MKKFVLAILHQLISLWHGIGDAQNKQFRRLLESGELPYKAAQKKNSSNKASDYQFLKDMTSWSIASTQKNIVMQSKLFKEFERYCKNTFPELLNNTNSGKNSVALNSVQ